MSSATFNAKDAARYVGVSKSYFLAHIRKHVAVVDMKRPDDTEWRVQSHPPRQVSHRPTRGGAASNAAPPFSRPALTVPRGDA